MERDPRTGNTVTAPYGQLETRMRMHAAEVLVVDGISDTYGGNENVRSEVKRYVNAAVALIPANTGAVLLLGTAPNLPQLPPRRAKARRRLRSRRFENEPTRRHAPLRRCDACPGLSGVSALMLPATERLYPAELAGWGETDDFVQATKYRVANRYEGTCDEAERGMRFSARSACQITGMNHVWSSELIRQTARSVTSEVYPRVHRSRSKRMPRLRLAVIGPVVFKALPSCAAGSAFELLEQPIRQDLHPFTVKHVGRIDFRRLAIKVNACRAFCHRSASESAARA